jgi:nifR3 family TIM-barrel protein
MKNFWQTLQKPILALAPLADVTDAAFRRIIAKYGKPDVMWTEFVSADGLVLAPEKGKKKLLLDLVYSEEERPIVAQFFTSKPEMMEKAAALAVELGFDGVDINMGCPDRSVEKQGAGAALIKTPGPAQELILAAKRGVESAGSGIPVSVKTRLGYNKDELETWLPALLEAKPNALIIHARTRKEMSKVPAHWDRIKRAVEIRDELGSKTLILGNGDVEDLAHARKIADETGADGIMLGRAIFGNPSLFSNSYELENRSNPEVVKKIILILIEHIKLFDELLACPPKPSAKAGGYKSFAVMKKHFKAYLVGLNISDQNLRHKLMETKTAGEAIKILETELSTKGLQ